jgi:hypothetical protein
MLFCVTIIPTPKVFPWNDFPVTLAQVELG